MCGIVGLIDLSGRAVDPTLLKAMTDTIRYRGPDDEGYVLIDQKTSHVQAYAGSDSPTVIKSCLPSFHMSNGSFRGNIGLSHRRFAIIDLTPGGHQPLFDVDGTCCVVFNGEIYNYLEVREELQAQGVQFRSHSDTEVLVEAYKAWGVECFRRLNGFWALALYDLKKKRLILSRDRLGKKPFYWARNESRIYFSSEIKALLQVPDIAKTKKVRPDAIWHWCVDGLRDLELSTFFEGIHTLPAASWTIVEEHFPKKIHTFWSVPQHRMMEKDISVSEAVKQIRETLQDAVHVRLRADVPLAVELSGGMDSSTLLALAAQSHPEKITTYTVKFADPQWNEEPFARSVAQHYNVDYRVVEPNMNTFWQHILAFTFLEEEPYHSPNLQVSQIIWSLMRADGIKVSLNGAVGDELFAGYDRYYPKAQKDNLRNARYWRFLDNALHYTQRRYDVRAAVRQVAQLLGVEHSLRRLKNVVTGNNGIYLSNVIRPCTHYGESTLTELLHNDMTNTLVPYWLRSGDKSHMGIPFEPRNPFLDYRVVEVATQLPLTYLIRHGWHKWILRKAMEGLLPEDVLWRKRKMGFPFPIQQFYAKYSETIDFIFSESNNPYIDFSNKAQLKRDWKAISFILWYELFINNNINLFKKIEDQFRSVEPNAGLGYRPEFLNNDGICSPLN